MKKIFLSAVLATVIFTTTTPLVSASTGEFGQINVDAVTGTVELKHVPDISFTGGSFTFDNMNNAVVGNYQSTVTDNFGISNLTDVATVPVYVKSITGLNNATLNLNNTPITTGTVVATITGTVFGDYDKTAGFSGNLGIAFANAADAKNAINGTITYGLTQSTIGE